MHLTENFDFNSELLLELLDELPFWSAPFGLRLLEKVVIRKHIAALDIGCGAGFPLTELAMRMGDTCKLYGIDPWEKAIARAQKKIDFYCIGNTQLISGVAETMPFENEYLDLITSNNGLNNVKDIDLTLAECSRVIKQGGQFIQTINLDSTMIELYDIMEAVFVEMSLPQSVEAMHQHIYDKRKPLDQYTEMLISNGFEIKKIEHDSFTYRFADGSTLLKHHLIRLAFIGTWKNLVDTNMQEHIFSLIEQRMNKVAESKGCFQLTVPFVVIDCRKR